MEDLTFWEGSERGMFELYSSEQHVHLVCREMSEDDMNTLIDIAAKFDCPLYDPQVSMRFDGLNDLSHHRPSLELQKEPRHEKDPNDGTHLAGRRDRAAR